MHRQVLTDTEMREIFDRLGEDGLRRLQVQSLRHYIGPFLAYFSALYDPTRTVWCALLCPCFLDADWGLQSDVMTKFTAQDGDPRVKKGWLPPDEVLRRAGPPGPPQNALDSFVTGIFAWLEGAKSYD